MALLKDGLGSIRGIARADFLENTLAARQHQIEKFGLQNHNSITFWSNILTEEVGEFAKAINELHLSRSQNERDVALHEAIHELRQVAAVAMEIYEECLFPMVASEIPTPPLRVADILQEEREDDTGDERDDPAGEDSISPDPNDPGEV